MQLQLIRHILYIYLHIIFHLMLELVQNLHYIQMTSRQSKDLTIILNSKIHKMNIF